MCEIGVREKVSVSDNHSGEVKEISGNFGMNPVIADLFGNRCK